MPNASPARAAHPAPARRDVSPGALLLLGALLAATACGAGAPAPAALTAAGAWARPALAGTDGAAYFTLHNTRRDTAIVVGLASPVAHAATLHETMTMGAGAGAMVHMTPLARAVVAPNDSLVLAPAGRHVMLEGLARALHPGDRVPLVVRFGSGDSLRVDATVRAP